MRRFNLLIGLSALCGTTLGQGADSVKVELSLDESRPSFKMGEEIRLRLSFTAFQPGEKLNTTVTEPASPVDTIVPSPTTCAFAVLDQADPHRCVPAYMTAASLEPGQPVTVVLPLNAIYRFDAPGRYSVHVVTTRVQGQGKLTTNDVNFRVAAMDEKEEAARVAELEQLVKLDPKGSRDVLAAEVCSGNARPNLDTTEIPFETLPETVTCLKQKLLREAGPPAKCDFRWTAEFVARFASSGIAGDVLALYQESGTAWDSQTRGFVLAYLVGCDAKDGLPLLEAALPATSPTPDISITWANRRPINWRSMRPPKIGRRCATGWRSGEPRGSAVTFQKSREGSKPGLTQAVMQGKHWRMPDAEAAALRQGCVFRLPVAFRATS